MIYGGFVLVKELACSLLKIKDRVKAEAPLIHCITNPISINDCANAVLALGAKPIMAEHPLETADIAARADALSVNLGNITDVRLKGISAAAESAVKNATPIIIDAVGVTCSTLRMSFCADFIKRYKPMIIKGNYAEINALAGESFSSKGIDSTEKDFNKSMNAAKALALSTGAVVLASGAFDIISQGKKTAIVKNGCELMGMLTGTGCMLGAITGTFLSCGAPFESAILGCGFFGACGELSSSASGTGSFRTMLMDNIFSVDNNAVSDMLKIELIEV